MGLFVLLTPLETASGESGLQQAQESAGGHSPRRTCTGGKAQHAFGLTICKAMEGRTGQECLPLPPFCSCQMPAMY